MRRADLAAAAKRLYERFLAPLVTGGDLTPGPAIGARAALSLDGGLAGVDPDLVSRVNVARVRMARRLVAVDVLEGPSPAEWGLAAALHDMVYALHPDLTGVLHRSAPDRLLDFAAQVVGRTPPAASLAEALSRHTFFARAFDLQRTDTLVSWWTGSRRFLGTAPPPRLLAWPELRRVQTAEVEVPLADLPDALGAARRERFRRVLSEWLEKVPVTDLATCTRPFPTFAWTGAALGLFATPHGRVLGLRALALGPPLAVDAALGRATLAHVKAEALENVARIGDVLAERALAVAAAERGGERQPEAGARDVNEDAHFARVLGASVALARADGQLGLAASGATARRLAARLMPLAQSARGRELATIVGRVESLLP